MNTFIRQSAKNLVLYLSYVGIRVAELNRSLEFYTKLFGLEEVSRGDNAKIGGGTYVLLKDPRSNAKLELNWYPDGSAYAPSYSPGEGLDHISFRVEDVPKTLERLSRHGIEAIPTSPAIREPDPGVMVAFVKDPDENWIELYHNPKPIGPEIPRGY